MEITIGSMKPEEDRKQNASVGASEQNKKVSDEMAERKGVKVQETAYDTVSPHGDTLSISEAGMAATSQKDNEPGNKDTTDGIVIRKEAEGNQQESDVSTVNLSIYTKEELRQMYLDGDITRAEYDEEISSREMRDDVNS